MINVYNKRGKRNYKEAKLIKELQPIIDKKINENPDLINQFSPANNFDELKRLHQTYVSEDVDFEEINEDKSNMATDKNVIEDEKIVNNDSFYEDEVENTFIDPFNREEPIVRDYVTDGGMEEDTAANREPNRTQFDEPVSWSEAFELPADEESQDIATNSQPKTQNQKQQNPKPEPKEPLNPSFDDMSSGKKRRSTKKFATYIVETVCMLAEKGFVWYANKDINESKLAEYEMSGEMDLSLLVTLEDGQEATVRQFFQGQTIRAEQLAKIDHEEKKDLAEVLAEVLLEKGIAPTASQELILIGLKIFGAQAIQLMALKSQTNTLLSQLRDMHSALSTPNNYDDNMPSEEPSYQAPAQEVSQPQPQPKEEILLSDDDLIIEKVIETKE
jgi:hypothetical protein